MRPRKNTFTKNKFFELPNISFLLLVAFLSLFGLIMIFSASTVIAYQFNDGDTLFFFKRQIIWLIAGSIIAFLIYLLDLGILKKLSLVILITSLLPLLMMFPESISGNFGIPFIDIPFVKTINGATRWIGLPFFDLQPSEFIKFSLIVYLASWLTKPANKKSSLNVKSNFVLFSILAIIILIFTVLLILQVDVVFTLFYLAFCFPTIFYSYSILNSNTLVKEFNQYFLETVLPFCLVIGLFCGFIILQRDLDTTVIIGLTMLSIFWASNTGKIHQFSLSAISNLMFGFGLIALFAEQFRKNRLQTFFNVFINGEPTSSDRLAGGFQVFNGLIALGSGGIWGAGYGESKQKLFYLQEAAYTDSIFAVLGEEFGFLGTSFVVILFLYFLSLGLKISLKSKDKYRILLGLGMTMWVTIQAFLNISANLSLIPFGGMPLPFFTYGGSSTVSIFLAVGVLLNLSKGQSKNQ